jgi:hypothetical protein
VLVFAAIASAFTGEWIDASIVLVIVVNDAVDRELIAKPERWDMRFIGRYMVEFGALSSVFDFLTFGVLLTSSARARSCSGRPGSPNRC